MLATIVRHKHRKREAFETLRILTAQRETGAASSKKETFTKARDGNISKALKHFHHVLCVSTTRLLVKYLLQVSFRRKRRLWWNFMAPGKCFKLGIFLPRRRKHDLGLRSSARAERERKFIFYVIFMCTDRRVKML